MKTLALLLLAAAGCTTTSGAFDDRAADIEGIYRVDSHLIDEDACQPGGDPVFGDDQFAYAKRITVFGQSILEVTSCASLADCRAQAAAVQPTGSFTFEFGLSGVSGDNLTGFESTTGFSGENNVCTMPELSDILAAFDGDTLTIQKSIKVGADYPADADGFCTTDAGRASASRATCSQMETLTASFLEPL